MNEETKIAYPRVLPDILRILILIVLLGVLSLPDVWELLPDKLSHFYSVFVSTSLVVFTAAVSHITRRVLFPYLDLKELSKRAFETPTGAAIVFLSVSMVVTALIVVNGMLIS